jgi:transposase-like protein
MLKVVHDAEASNENAAGGSLLDEIVRDGALGFWAALREVFPETREQRCWFHKMANVLNCLPKSAQPGAKAALAEIWAAEDSNSRP